jgi:SAM-dependent methyltransferase
MAWYKDWFRDANYRTVYEHRDEQEAEAAIELVERTIGHDTRRRVLDLACGSGRHALSFARRGYSDVTGIDLSPTLLAEARHSAEFEGLPVKFLERDMRDIPEERFDLALNLFTSFGYFDSDDDNAAVIEAVASHLSPGGYFVIDFFNSKWLRSHYIARDERNLPSGSRLEQTRWIENGRIEKRLIIRERAEAQEYIESVRLFELSDFEAMFAKSGLRLTQTFGGYTGEPFVAELSHRLIMFAQR